MYSDMVEESLEVQKRKIFEKPGGMDANCIPRTIQSHGEHVSEKGLVGACCTVPGGSYEPVLKFLARCGLQILQHQEE